MDQTPDFASLSKKERKRLKRELDRQESYARAKKSGMMKWFIVGIILILLAGGGWWLVQNLSKPLPGRQLPDQGRDHVGPDQWGGFAYNSNPPTSGPHDEIWTKAGVYDSPQGDGYLVHSLEHGYIVISYNCGLSGGSNVSQGEASDSTVASVSATTGSVSPLSTQDCDNLKKQLTDLAHDKKIWKLIVIPRSTLEVRIALTAWTWLENLDDFDKNKIVDFIDAHRNHGPEQTME